MPREEIIRDTCDVCARERKEENHWFFLGRYPSTDPAWMVGHFNAHSTSQASIEESTKLACGMECLLRLVTQEIG